jgi:WD40 repeat protein
VLSLAVSPKGRRAATGDTDGRVWLWDLTDDAPSVPLSGHGGAVYALAFHPEGQTLATGDAAGTVRLWGVPSGQLLQTLQGSPRVEGLGFSADGRLLAVSGPEDGVSLWELPEGRLVRVAKAVEPAAPEVSADLRYFGSRNPDHSLALNSLQAGGPLERTLAGHTDAITCLAFDPSSRVLVSGGADRTVQLWGLPGGEPLATLEGHTGRVSCLAISPDSATLASADSRGTVRVWGSELLRLSALPVGKIGTAEVAWAEKMLRDESVGERDRAWLEFVVAVVRHRRRFDIHLDDGPQRIAVGEFDIEISG